MPRRCSLKFTLDRLDSVEFENFCYDLLRSLDFVNISWRKGTGYSSSPADQGRDIEAQYQITEFDGNVHLDKWFVECKHYQRGVPPEKLHGSIAWASAERPKVLLIIASNYLSNPAKMYLEKYEKENRPSFRIKVWELPDLENLTITRPQIRRKYNLSEGMEFLSVIENSHLLYVSKPRINSIGYFLQLMDGLDPAKRDELFGFTYRDVIQPRVRESISGDESIADRTIDPVDYPAFREKCLRIREASSPNYVHKIVTNTLAWLFQRADKTEMHSVSKRQLWLIEQLEKEKDVNGNSPDFKSKDSLLQTMKEMQASLPQRYEHNCILYRYICDELVRKLLIED